MSLFSKQESYLGVDIGAHGIKVVELRKTKGRPQLWTYGLLDEALDIHVRESFEKGVSELLSEHGKTLPIDQKKDNLQVQLDDPRISQYADLLRAVIKQAKVTTKKTTASVPVSYIFHAVVTLPKMEDKEIEHAVLAEVKKMMPRPIEEMQVVHQKIPDLSQEAGDKYMRILVTAAPKDLVRFYTAIFQKAGLELEELETEAFAVERSLVGLDKATAMVVDIGAERTNFFIIDQSLPLTHRSINIGGNNFDEIIASTMGLDKNLVSQVKKDISRIKEKINPDIFMPVLEPIIKEIDYSFDLFLNQTGNQGKKPEKIILTGGSSVLPFIKDKIAAAFPMRVFVGDPWARVVYQEGLRDVLDNIGPRMAVAIGLALRNIV